LKIPKKCAKNSKKFGVKKFGVKKLQKIWCQKSKEKLGLKNSKQKKIGFKNFNKTVVLKMFLKVFKNCKNVLLKIPKNYSTLANISLSDQNFDF